MSAREQITEALFRFDTDSVGGLAGESYEAVADALMPLVDRLCAEAAAEALETFADDLWRPLTADGVKQDLRERAATLRAKAGS